MCVRHLRFCRECSKAYLFDHDSACAPYPIVLLDSLCFVPQCCRYSARQVTYCTAPCPNNICNVTTCRTEFIYLTCRKLKASDWRFVSRP